MDGAEDVMKTISLSNNDSSGKGINGREQPVGIIHFDNVSKDAQFASPPEIEPLRCNGDSLAVHQQSKFKIRSQTINTLILLCS